MTLSGVNEPTEAAELVLRGGAVIALDVSDTRTEAIAISAGRIVALGSNAESDRWISETTRVVELEGRAVIPGINDSHLHAVWLGARWPHTFFGAEDPEAAAQISGTLLASREERRASILRAGRLLTELGITSYTEPGIGPGEDDGETGCFHSEVLDVYRELAEEGELLQRVTALALYGILDGPSDLETVLAGIRSHETHQQQSDPAWLNIPGVKIFGDLIPLTRQAWTRHSYDNGTHGDLLVNGETLEEKAAHLAEMIREAHRAGLQVGVHATGDRTIELVIDAVSEAAAEPGAESARSLAHSIIHGDLVTESQLTRMAELGMWLNAQPGIAIYTADWLAGVMGSEAAEEAWPFGFALDLGVLLLSSDAPVLTFDWRRRIAEAELRIAGSGGATDERAVHQRLFKLLRAYTALPAEQDRASEWKGTLEIGKVADLVVLAEDPFAVGAAGLPEVDIDLTVLDGRVVFDRSAV